MMDKRLLALVPNAMRHVIATVAWQWVNLLGNVCLVWAIARLLFLLATGLMGGTSTASADAAGSIDPGMLALDAASLQICVLLLAASLVVRVAATRMAAKASFAASQDVKRTLRRRIYEKLLKLGPTYTEQVPTAEVVQLSVEGCEQLETYFGQYLPQLFYAVLAPLTLFALVAPICLSAAVILLVCVPLIPLTIMAVQNIAKRILGKYWDQYAELGDSFLENLQGLTTLKIYQADAARHEAMNAEAERFRVVTMKVLSMQLNSIIVMDVVALGGAVAGMAAVLYAMAAGNVSLFGGLFVILISADFFLPMRQLGSFFHVAMNGMAAANKIFKLLALPEPAPRTLAPVPGDRFELKDLSFGYTAEREVLHGISLSIPATGLTAIVGSSGCGKSTIAALLSGRYDGYRGQLLLGENQVRDIDSAALARYVTTVGLGAHLFAGSVRDNLLMAAPDASDDELWKALESARLATFLRGQQGLDTQLTENGANLSGGQRQRLSFARALLHNSAAYVFDEATSNIDAESEEAIMAAIRELAERKSVIVISHRLANAVCAQNIYVLDQGTLVGSGTHQELLASCPAYQSLWETQQELEAFASGQHTATPAAEEVRHEEN